MVLSFLGKRIHDQGLSMKSVGAMLQKETATIQNALPAGLSDVFWPHAQAACTASPVIAQTINPQRSYAGGLAALALAGLAVASFWVWSHAHRAMVPLGIAPAGEASRMKGEANRFGDLVNLSLPDHVAIRVSANGLESKLLGIIESPGTAGESTWLEFDRLTFDSGSSTLRPDSSGQLDHIAAVLKAYPHVRLRIAGFTDNLGDTGQNLGLSRERAESVKAELVSRGISADRLITQGLGELSPSVDHAASAGRATSGRVSLQVIQK
jgi:outer membrane protein OmpA-like peptidoglycan-associated protein